MKCSERSSRVMFSVSFSKYEKHKGWWHRVGDREMMKEKAIGQLFFCYWARAKEFSFYDYSFALVLSLHTVLMLKPKLLPSRFARCLMCTFICSNLLWCSPSKVDDSLRYSLFTIFTFAFHYSRLSRGLRKNTSKKEDS